MKEIQINKTTMIIAALIAMVVTFLNIISEIVWGISEDLGGSPVTYIVLIVVFMIAAVTFLKKSKDAPEFSYMRLLVGTGLASLGIFYVLNFITYNQTVSSIIRAVAVIILISVLFKTAESALGGINIFLACLFVFVTAMGLMHFFLFNLLKDYDGSLTKLLFICGLVMCGVSFALLKPYLPFGKNKS